MKLHKELEHDADNDEIKKKNAKRNDIKDTRKKRKTERTASETPKNKKSQSLLRRENLYKSMQWPKVQKRNIINSTNTGKKEKKKRKSKCTSIYHIVFQILRFFLPH